jgi:hypothetical protein
MIECPRCGFKLSDAGPTLPPLEVCPSCGQELVQQPQVIQTSLSLIQSYFFTIWRILTRPSLFFKALPDSGGLSQPLCFALVTHWLGAALSFLWRSLIGGKVAHIFQSLFQVAGDVVEVDHPGRGAQFLQFRDRIFEWFLGAGPVLLDPFLTLFTILFTSFLVYLGARILVSPGKDHHPEEITYSSAVRIISYGMTPSLLAAIPLLGGFVASLCTLIVTVIGAREVYRISTGRAILIALFPKLLFLGIIVMGIFIFAFVVLKFLFSVF